MSEVTTSTTLQEFDNKLRRACALLDAGVVTMKEYHQSLDDADFLGELEHSRPTHVKIYPLMASIAGQYKGYGGALKLYTFSRGLDVSGSGQVKRDDLLAYILALGMCEKTFARWLAIALKIGIVKEHRDGEVLAYIGMAKAAFALGARDFIGGRLVEVNAKELAGRKWRAEVWRGHLATTRGRPITRDKLRDITAIAPSTQRRLENNINRRRGAFRKLTNWHVYEGEEINEHPQASLEAFKEHKHSGAFIMRTGYGRKAIVARGPNSYICDAFTLARKGRSRKVNKAIRRFASLERYGGLSNTRQAMSYDTLQDDGKTFETLPYLYHETEAQTDRAKKIASQMENPPSCFFRLERTKLKSGFPPKDANFWTVTPYNAEAN